MLSIAKRQFKSEELGTDDVFLRVISRPVHPEDKQILSAVPQFSLPEDDKRKDYELALSLATTYPELFQVAHEYEFDDFQNFQKAIQHVSRPGKTGIVLLRSSA